MVTGGKINIDPWQLSLNGAPIQAKADVNLEVPGYQYNVNFEAHQVPVAPLVNTFQPDRKGKLGGTLFATAQFKGAGTKMPKLEQNLDGHFDVGTTNLALKLIDVRSSLLKGVINVVIGLPGIIRNPKAALSGIVARVTGEKSLDVPGWIDEVAQSPINVIECRGQMSAGRVDVQRAFVQSPAFQIETQGTVDLAPEVTNSTIHFPVSLSLRRSLAAKIGQASGSTPTNVTYVKLPEFVTMVDTLGKPRPDYNYVALGQMALKLTSGVVGGTGKAVLEQVTHGVGSLEKLLGGKSSTNNASTNAPSENKGPLPGFLEKLIPPRQTPATNQPPTTNQPPQKRGIFDLFK